MNITQNWSFYIKRSWSVRRRGENSSMYFKDYEYGKNLTVVFKNILDDYLEEIEIEGVKLL